MAYLLELVGRLSEGCGRQTEQQRENWAQAVKGFQTNDGGFRGRSDESDIYYTAFAVRTLAIIDGLDDVTAERIRKYLESLLQTQTTLIDLVSLLFSASTLDAVTGGDLFQMARDDWAERFVDELERHRCDDGGYARTPKGAAGSTYQTFLNLLCFELLDSPVPEPERIVAFLLSQEAEGGGFLEIRAAKRAGTNPTAAAIGSLQILGSLSEEIRDRARPFFHTLISDEGGFRAHTRIPIADLLSTFTGLWTLDRLGETESINVPEIGRFVESLEVPGGYLGAILDEQADVEYLFYGVGTIALLALIGE